MATSGVYTFASSAASGLTLVAFGRIGIRRTEITMQHLTDAASEANLLQVAINEKSDCGNPAIRPLIDWNECGTIRDPNDRRSRSMARKKKCAKTNDLFDYARDNRASIVYMATNTVNGKRYIGITRLTLEKRKKTHFMNANRCEDRHRQPLYSAIRKYGEDVFTFEAVCVCDTYKKACATERLLIAETRPEYNVTRGGEGIVGHRHSAESRRKMSAAKKGRGPWKKGECPPEVREKLAASARARKGTFKYTQKQIEASRKKLLNNVRYKPVICFPDWLAFNGTSSAARHYGLCPQSIANYCYGKSKPKNDRQFIFVEDWLK